MRTGVPFRFKLFGIGALALLAALTALGVSQWFLVERTLDDQLRQRADGLRPLLCAALASPLAERDYAAIQEILRESVTERGLLYLALVDANGRVFASAGDLDANQLMPPASAVYATSPGGDRFLPFEERVVVSDQFLARLHFGLSTRPIDEASSRLLIRAAVVAAVSLLFSIVLMELLHTRLTRPLRRLGEASRQVRAGRYDVDLPPGDNDEIGQLTENFRHMVAEVKGRVSALTAAESRLQALLDEAGVREQRLSEARIEAEAASQAKSMFLARMSHEIRTPLNGVLGMLELLLGEPLDAAQHRYAELARQSGRHLLEIVEDVLDFSRIEAGRIRIEPAPFEPRRLFGDLVELFAPAARTKGLRLSLRCAELPEWLIGDAGRCRQIIGNLVGNAVKFTAAGSITVEASCTSGPEAKSAMLHCRITDTGIGIAPEALTRLFAPFVQADESFSRRYEGMGLGLAICRGLASAMGGTIRATSTEGRGSTFEVEVPMLRADGAIAAAGRLGEPPVPATFVGQAVLLVEDNPVNRTIAEDMLARLGCSVFAVETGSAALAAECCARFTAIFLDLQLPDIDGFEVAQRLRARWAADEVTPVPIIALTANAFDSDRERCREAGMQGFVSKPCSEADLAHALAELAPA